MQSDDHPVLAASKRCCARRDTRTARCVSTWATSPWCGHMTDIPVTPIAQWGHAVLGLDDHALYRVVNKLELANDYYEVGKNDPETCRARYRSVCARLRLLKEESDQGVYSLTRQGPERDRRSAATPLRDY
jgi:hypothetical protein